MKKSNFYFNQTGASLLEVVIAIVIGLAVGITGLYMLNARVLSVEDGRVTNEAENAGEEALSALSGSAPALVSGGSFTAVSDNILTLSACTTSTCDYVLLPDISSSWRTSPSKGYPYGSPIPTGYSVAFFRRWRVEDVNPTYNLRKITVAILKDEDDNKPSLIAETTIKILR